jgi:hypothetical protein
LRDAKARDARTDVATAPVTDAAILDRLRGDAQKGDTRAAKEAREWARHIAAGQGTDAGLDVLWDELDPSQLEAVYVRLTRQLCSDRVE